MRTTIIGIDCATKDERIGVARAYATFSECVVEEARSCSKGEPAATVVSRWLHGSDRAIIAIDAPLGWPEPLGHSLIRHVAGETLAAKANEMFRRKTDDFIATTIGKRPLDVGADRIARTAHAALRLLDDIRSATELAIPLAWSSSFTGAAAIEVYPAATLKAHGFSIRGYKDDLEVGVRARDKVLSGLSSQLRLDCETKDICENVDILDAVVCVLAGYDFLARETYSPSSIEHSKKEGWIWVRTVVANTNSL